MAAVSKRQLQILKPFLEAGGANDMGEWGMHCPFHDDVTRSASINIEKGVWFCQVCNDGGGVRNLINRIELDQESTGGSTNVSEEDDEDGKEQAEAEGPIPVTEAEVGDWHEHLVSSPRILEEFERLRGLSSESVRRYQIGWDARRKSFTIPIRDSEGVLRNVRWYNPAPQPGRRKIWGLKGQNTPRLYPISILQDTKEIIITEGEWDALLTIQMGFPAITRTAAAGVWKSSWNTLFDDKVVYICQDMDDAGVAGADKIRRELTGHAREIHMLELPYEVEEKHGADLSDFFHKDGHDAADLEELMDASVAMLRPPEVVEKEFIPVEVIDSFSAERAGERLRMRTTVTGKKSPPFLLPKEVIYDCGQDAGAKCNVCPMAELGGSATRHIDGHDPIILEMMGSTSKQIIALLRDTLGAQQCNSLKIETPEYRSVEELFVRPSVDIHHDNPTSGDYTSRKIVSVGSHDTTANNTVEVVGSIFPNPRGQHNEFLAWEVEKTETTIDNFHLTPAQVKMLKVFQSERALHKVMEIAKDMSLHVTKIYGRNEVHAMMDLVYHSALGFRFSGVMQIRGWLEALFVGDTRTGKSEIAERMRHFFSAGEMVSCESASFAGIVGGLQQVGSGKEWEITWGAIPVNDRRLVILDEISGLTQEQIGQMSSIRSSGEAQLTKIRSERTWARTRLIWMGNPRNGRMNNYTYGVNAILPLIGNNEDVARFDFAMSLKQDEVSPEEINKVHGDPGPQRYGSEACSTLLRWVWSRTPEQVIITPEAEAEIFKQAVEMGKRYIEIPPLVQSANVRIKIARLAVSIAARTFSTDEDHDQIVVLRRHVVDAVKLIDHIYNMPGFGYAEISKEAIEDVAEAAKLYDEAKQYMYTNRGLSKFLRSMHGMFRSQDLQDMMNLSREEANAMIGSLWKYRLISRQGPNIRINPILHDLLREVKE